MEAPPVIATRDATRIRDFYLRSLFAIVIGVVGFWWPEWYASRIPPQNDSRVGIVFIYTLPFVIAAAAWATMAFKGSYRPRYISAGLLLLVWSPAFLLGARIILLALYVAELVHSTR